MIRYKDTILENYSIDPETAIITNSKGEVQRTYIHKGRLCFKGHTVHQWQMHTNFGSQNMDIHHLDGNKFNNSLSNLVYLNRNEHAKIHSETRELSEDTKKKLSAATKGRIWINNGVIAKMVKCNEEIPTGFIRGRLKKMNGDFLKFCYKGFKKNDAKFPKEWTFDDYKKYTEECNIIILEKENEKNKI